MSDLPFPTDLAKDPTTGRLNIPYCMTDSPSTIGLKMGLRTLDGYALNTAITVRFSAEIDPSSAIGAVKIVGPDGTAVPYVTAFFADRKNTLVIKPTILLNEKTTYLVAIDNTIRGKDGRPIVADRVVTFAKSTEPLVDAKGYSVVAALDDATANGLEGLRQAFAPAFAKAEVVTGKSRKDLLWVFTFTTQTAYTALRGLSQLVESQGGAQVSHDTAIRAADHPLVRAAGIPVSNVCAIHTGHVQARGLLTATGTFGVDAMGRPVTSTTSIDYVLTTPKSAAGCPTIEPWNLQRVVVFAHALGRCKNDALALANAFAGAGYATLAIDGPRAGSRAVGTLGDQDLDGCPDSPATPELLLAGSESLNPFGLRDRMRQWALDLSQVATRVRLAPWEFVGQAAPQNAVPARVVMAGHSWGGMATLLAGPISGASAVAVNAASGDLGSVLAPIIGASVAASMPGATAEQIAAATDQAVSSLRWALEPGDALTAFKGYSALPALLQVVSAGNADAALHAKADQSRLAFVYSGAGAKGSTFTLADSEDSPTFCANASASVGSLLKPCAAKGADAATMMKAGAAYLGMQRQLVTFLATATSTGAVVCDPNITVACP